MLPVIYTLKASCAKQAFARARRKYTRETGLAVPVCACLMAQKTSPSYWEVHIRMPRILT